MNLVKIRKLKKSSKFAYMKKTENIKIQLPISKEEQKELNKLKSDSRKKGRLLSFTFLV